MKQNLLKILIILVITSIACAGYALEDNTKKDIKKEDNTDCSSMYPNAMFTAKGCETQRISIGALVASNYQWAQLRFHTNNDPFFIDNSTKVLNPADFNNFYMKNIRLFMRADLCDNWSTVIGIDFGSRNSISYSFDASQGETGSATISSLHECNRQPSIFIDRAYIQKKFCNSTFRAGYQKVNFCAEENISDQYVKTIDRSITTNFFVNLGKRPVNGVNRGNGSDGTDTGNMPDATQVEWGGNRFANRHFGLFLNGDINDNFKYSVAIVNGYQGFCLNSTQFNNDLGYFASITYESKICDIDILIGINAGYKPKGGDWTSDPFKLNNSDPTSPCIGGNGNGQSVWGFNPYIFANWNCFSILAEMLYGSVENAQLINSNADANPWGFNLTPSYMLNDSWELVARYAYLNTNKMSVPLSDASGSVPVRIRSIIPILPETACNPILGYPSFEKVTSGYIGLNYYTANEAIKISLGYEYTKFRHAFVGPVGSLGSPAIWLFPTKPTGYFSKANGDVQLVRAQLQLLF